ncbi:hypothetical protein BJF92_12190 [Rhizobium rhizosphaerae]|uniref:Uncharacterized protein n=1 Tax=Xaviernesmea rhizosphaerae TaxID=1672749 RepID=A0A1Q9AN60_9HYPH|nr:hypothetical protein [Xaviernesmea rhizosphaerae]OLP56824.1 hypothetical protein BJF92_12190 [Xaviernesmea rhizosphaerae]
MAAKEVILSRRYEVPGVAPFDRVTLREPTYADRYMSGLGLPQEWQPNGRGGGMVVTYPEVVDAYLQRLIVSPGYEHISGISATDGGRLEAALAGFFLEPTGSTASPTNLSSGSDGSPAASPE